MTTLLFMSTVKYCSVLFIRKFLHTNSRINVVADYFYFKGVIRRKDLNYIFCNVFVEKFNVKQHNFIIWRKLTGFGVPPPPTLPTQPNAIQVA